jgi:uncharacterized protein YndB with AHSA1/START domain
MPEESGLEQASEHTITVRWVFDAPRELVWKEWTEPERFADWFGFPEAEAPLSAVSMDVKPGGVWRAKMFTGPLRHETQWWGEYREVIKPERLVFTFCNRPDDDGCQLVSVALRDLGGSRTEMLFEQRGQIAPDLYDRATKGWASFFNRISQRMADAC